MRHTATGTCCLVSRDPHKLSPGNIGNGFGQTVTIDVALMWGLLVGGTTVLVTSSPHDWE